MNMENLLAFSPFQFHLVSHLLTLGFAAMLAALFYFVLTMRTVAPKFRISSVISVVVMVSAFLILYYQFSSWETNFVYDAVSGMFVKSENGTLFTNGFRYLNWLIDVPMLLFQILFVVSIAAAKRARLRNWFFFSGAMMIITGYVGQSFEVAADKTLYWVMFVVSSLFFVHICRLIHQVIFAAKKEKGLPVAGRKILSIILGLFYVSRLLYPVAYLMPVISMSADGVVVRQLVFTIADISAKIIYGVLLVQFATIKSKMEGFEYEKIAD